MERITRLARLASALADTHPTDEQSPRTVLCFATVFSSLDCYNLKIKNPHRVVRIFIFGADYETRSARFCARRHAPDRRTVPPDCSLLRNGLFESRLLQSENKKSPPCGEDFYFWSGLRDSNSLPSPWQGDALPDELNPQLQDLL